jgi:hypothetical protein
MAFADRVAFTSRPAVAARKASASLGRTPAVWVPGTVDNVRTGILMWRWGVDNVRALCVNAKVTGAPLGPSATWSSAADTVTSI